MSKVLYGAIEAGGTKFICEVADADGKIRAHTRIPTTTPETTLATVLDFFAGHAAVPGDYAGFGIAAFGPLELQPHAPAFGHILDTPKPHWPDTDLVSPFRKRFGCPVKIDTDVNAAALAEARYGAGRGCSRVVYVTVGTGIGGGLFLAEYTPPAPMHAEMGHIRVLRHARDRDFAGICPFHGACLEGLASGPAIAARFGTSLDKVPDADGAGKVIGCYLGQLATTVILLLSPQRIIFGGGVMAHTPLLNEIRQTAATLLNGYAGMGVSASALQELIVAPGLGERSGIAGALALAMQCQSRRRVEST